jgi:predicted nucleotidyltransferase
MDIIERIQNIKNKLTPLLKDYKIKKAGLFGSVLRQDYNDQSDIDLLVEFMDQPNYTSYFKFHEDIENALNKNIDLIQYKLIKPSLKDYILPQEVRIYEVNS